MYCCNFNRKKNKKQCPYCTKKSGKVNYLDSVGFLYHNIAKMIVENKNNHMNYMDTYNITIGGHKKYKVNCMNCGTYIGEKTTNSMLRNLNLCDNCKDKPIPEKFMENLLYQLNIDFIFQLNKKHFSWCKNYRYDFYLPKYNMIIETNGRQHYKKNGFVSCGGASLTEVNNTDQLKRTIAYQNGIKDYIEINCSESEYMFLKSSVTHSLLKYFDLKKVDWDLIWESCQTSIFYKICESYNVKNEVKYISEKLNITRSSVRKYLRQANDMGILYYNGKENTIKALSNRKSENRIGVVAIVGDEKFYFDSITEGSIYFGVNRKNISSVLKSKRKSCGVYNDKKIKWMLQE